MAREPKHWRDMEDSICELRTWAILIHSINSDIWEECKREKTPNGRERISVNSDTTERLGFCVIGNDGNCDRLAEGVLRLLGLRGYARRSEGATMTTDAHKPCVLALFVTLWRLRLARLLLWAARRFDAPPFSDESSYMGWLTASRASRAQDVRPRFRQVARLSSRHGDGLAVT